MKILIAPGSFKGSLSATEAAAAIAAGVRRIRPDAELVLLPLADGGEGTVEALVAATGGQQMKETVTGPLGLPVEAAWGLLGGKERTAVIEMAAAAGLPLVPPAPRDPRQTTTYGVGELLLLAAQSGAKRIIIGLGGSATNDGGAGAMQALGVKFYASNDNLLTEKLTGGALAALKRIDAAELHPALSQLKIILASDVTNPLLGLHGASAVYGPQKGATAEIVMEMESALSTYATVLRRDLGKDVAEAAGAGAAGGLGAGLMAFLDAEMQSGIDLVLDAAGFNEKLRGADWVFTGEGRIDPQTLSGKTITGVLKRCRDFGSVPVLAFGGSVDDQAAESLAQHGLRAAFPIVSGPMSLADSMRDSFTLLSQAAARVTRVLGTYPQPPSLGGGVVRNEPG